MSIPSGTWWKGLRGEWYVVAQLALMALIFFGPQTLAALPEWPLPESRLWLVGGAALMVAGGAFLVCGIVCLRRQLTPLPYPTEQGHLIQSGPFAVVRHPMYSGGLVLALGWAMIVHGWLTLLYVAVFFAFVVVKSRREERWLEERYPEYPDYRRRVAMLVPFVY